ncbi:MAG: NfeD family protein [Geminocystis sp.]
MMNILGIEKIMSSPLVWLIIGCILCLMEFIFPTAFVELMMGLSAIIIAGLALIIPYNNLLIVLWMVLSVLLIYFAKKYLEPKKKDPLLLEGNEGITITAIEAGKTGRVMYEGSLWLAICSDETMKIPPDEKVFIVSREGNILSVLPRKLL